MYIQNIFFIVYMLFLLGCSGAKMEMGISSSSCNREVIPYSLDALEKNYSCQNIQGES
jgi:hypothetical protein